MTSKAESTGLQGLERVLRGILQSFSRGLTGRLACGYAWSGWRASNPHGQLGELGTVGLFVLDRDSSRRLWS
jgi:hypothetical protein